MKILLSYKGKYTFNVLTEAKRLAKEKGCKIKDIGTIELNQMDYGVSLSVWSKDNKFITNCAC